MTDPTREEMDAKLDAVEARLETRLTSIDGKLDRLFDNVNYVARTATEAKNAADKAHDAASNIKWNILFTALGVLGVIVAMWAILNS